MIILHTFFFLLPKKVPFKAKITLLNLREFMTAYLRAIHFDICLYTQILVKKCLISKGGVPFTVRHKCTWIFHIFILLLFKFLWQISGSIISRELMFHNVDIKTNVSLHVRPSTSGGVAQMVERSLSMREVSGSGPARRPFFYFYIIKKN